MRPPWRSTIWRQMGSPRPVPLGFSVSVSPACLNFSKMVSRSLAAMPEPLSATATRTSSPTAAADRRTQPVEVNLTALPMRLSSTCTSRSRSAMTAGRSEAMSVARVRPLRAARGAAALTAWSATAARDTGFMSHSQRPDSILAMSSTSSTSSVSRSPSATMMSRFSRICPAPRATRASPGGRAGATSSRNLRRMILANPSTDVSGVRSSWETVEMNSVFIRSTSFSTVTSRTSKMTAVRSWPGRRKDVATTLPVPPSDRATSVSGQALSLRHEAARAAMAGGKASRTQRPAGSAPVRPNMASRAGLCRVARPASSTTSRPSARLSMMAWMWARESLSSRVVSATACLRLDTSTDSWPAMEPMARASTPTSSSLAGGGVAEKSWSRILTAYSARAARGRAMPETRA